MPNWRCGSERQNKDVALNVEKKQGSGCQNENVALNAKRKMNNDSKRQMKKGGCFNVKMKMQLWTPK